LDLGLELALEVEAGVLQPEGRRKPCEGGLLLGRLVGREPLVVDINGVLVRPHKTHILSIRSKAPRTNRPSPPSCPKTRPSKAAGAFSPTIRQS
jgi:hypothetical protein